MCSKFRVPNSGSAGTEKSERSEEGGGGRFYVTFQSKGTLEYRINGGGRE